MRRHQIVLALLLWSVSACTAWHVEEGISPQQLIATRHPASVRVTLADRSQLVLKKPTIIPGDSLAGINGRNAWTLATADVRQIAIRRVSGDRTVGAVLGVGLLGVAVGGVIALQAMCILSC